MITPLARLLSEYLATIAVLARDEAKADLARMASLAKRRALAAGAALLGLVWLNAALLLWILQSEWRVLLALLVGVLAMVVAWVLARPGASGAKPMLSETRALVQEEMQTLGFGASEPASGPASGEAPAPGRADAARGGFAAPPAPRLEPATARVHLHDIRVEMGRVLAPTERAGEAAGAPAAGSEPPPVGFMPKSRTMQLLMAVWGGRPRGSAFGTVTSSLLGFVALRNRKIRRLATMIGLARNATRLVGRRLKRA